MELIATLGPVGYMPIAPGTWGSAVAAALWWWGLAYLPPFLYISFLVLLVFPMAVWSADKTERRLGKDAHPIVIDEVLGQWIALIGIERRLAPVLGAFFLFRLFDIWKPYPIDRSQRLKGGWGVVLDDVLAGIYAGILLHLLVWFISSRIY
ncbi:MAG: phosphatidylglycerophosphatase A [Calditrichota bacterium]